MQKKRRLTLNLAISLDGYTCDPEVGFDWITGDGDTSNDTHTQFNFQGYLEDLDTIIVGKKAYDDAPKGSLEAYKSHKIYAVSHSSITGISNNIEVIQGNLLAQLEVIRSNTGKNIWLYGGITLAVHFIKANIVDEYIIGIIPSILGVGVKLFQDNNPTIKLQLTETTVQEGIVILRYTKREVSSY